MFAKIAIGSRENQQPFQYPKLNHDYELRLLKLDRYPTLDESSHHAITGSFTNVPSIEDLAKNPSPYSYVAISYCWGNLEKVDKIWISDTEFINITASVASILRHMRCMDQKIPGHYLWIDQICINQDDAEEKSQQVQMMFCIYYLADHVIAWLGGTEDDGDLAMEAIFDWNYSLVVEELLDRTSLTLSEHSPVFDPYEALTDWNQTWSPTHPLYRDSRVRTALARFLDRSWFERTWILQEMVAAKRVTIMIEGQHHLSCRGISAASPRSIEWDSLVRFAKEIEKSVPHLVQLQEQYRTSSNGNTVMPRGFASITRIMFLRDNRRRTRQRTPFQQNLLLTAKTEASDPRDKIYAIVPFSLELEAPELQADYSSSIEKVYTSATRYILLLDQKIDVLHSAGIGWIRRISQLPSWVPDYSQTNRTSSQNEPDVILHGISTSLFAAGSFSYMDSTDYSISSSPSDPTVLQIDGILTDQVEIVTPGFSTGRSLWRLLHSNRQVDRQLVKFWFETTLVRICANNSQNAYLGNARSNVKPLLWKHELYSEFEGFISALAAGLSSDKPWGPGAVRSDHILICKYILDFLSFVAQVSDYEVQLTSSDASLHATDNLRAMCTKLVEKEGSGIYHIYPGPPELDSLFPDDSFFTENVRWFLSTPNNLISMKRIEAYLRSVEKFANWCVFRTKSGYIGRGPPMTRPGDQVCIFTGSSTPFLLRKARASPLSLSDRWQLVGECYVQGLMHKEAILTDGWSRNRHSITLV